jgi:hypothetical protein
MFMKVFHYALLAMLCAAGDVSFGVPGEATTKVDFAHEVLPIINAHCLECHGGTEAEGGFSVNTREHILDSGAAEAGNSVDSRMIELVSSDDPDYQMPPNDRVRLAAAEIKVLQDWIDQGLPWEDGFTFGAQSYETPLKPRRPRLPPPIDGRDNPIDRILDHYLAEHDVARPSPLDDAQFLRRVYYDLIGLPPTPEQLEEFLQNQSVEKRSMAIDKLLTNREAYATHWLTFWNDLLRNAYSGTGYIDGGRKQITRWLYAALHDNKHYDQFVRELISPAEESAGFIDGIKWRGNVNASQGREIQFAQNISQVFLGINMKCASCHDSFIDRWTMAETYGLAAIYAERPLELHRCDEPTGKFATAAWIFPDLGSIDPQASKPERLNQLAGLMTHPQNGRLNRTIVNRLWQRLMGRGIVHPVDALQMKPFSQDLLDFLSVELADQDYDLKQILRLIVSSQAYQSQSVVLKSEPSTDNYIYSGPMAKRLSAEQFMDSIWLITGTWLVPDQNSFVKEELTSKEQYQRAGGQLTDVLSVVEPNLSLPKNADEIAAIFSRHPMLSRASLRTADALQTSLGRPNREQVVTTRPTQLTTLESMTLANDPVFADMLGHGAAQVARQHAGSPTELIDWLFRAILTREPSSREVELAQKMLGESMTKQSLEDLLWTLCMLPEFHLLR